MDQENTQPSLNLPPLPPPPPLSPVSCEPSLPTDMPPPFPPVPLSYPPLLSHQDSVDSLLPHPPLLSDQSSNNFLIPPLPSSGVMATPKATQKSAPKGPTKGRTKGLDGELEIKLAMADAENRKLKEEIRKLKEENTRLKEGNEGGNAPHEFFEKISKMKFNTVTNEVDFVFMHLVELLRMARIDQYFLSLFEIEKEDFKINEFSGDKFLFVDLLRVIKGRNRDHTARVLHELTKSAITNENLDYVYDRILQFDRKKKGGFFIRNDEDKQVREYVDRNNQVRKGRADFIESMLGELHDCKRSGKRCPPPLELAEVLVYGIYLVSLERKKQLELNTSRHPIYPHPVEKPAPPFTNPSIPAPVGNCFRVKADYFSREARELTVKQGDVVYVKSTAVDGWWLCKHPSGMEGCVHSFYLEPVQTVAPPPRPFPFPSLSGVGSVKRFGNKFKKRDGHKPVGKGEETPENKTYLGHLPVTMTDDELRMLFVGYGVRSAYVAVFPDGRSKGFGFVTFSTHEEQQRALTDKGSSFIVDRQKVIFAPFRNRDPRGPGLGTSSSLHAPRSCTAILTAPGETEAGENERKGEEYEEEEEEEEGEVEEGRGGRGEDQKEKKEDKEKIISTVTERLAQAQDAYEASAANTLAVVRDEVLHTTPPTDGWVYCTNSRGLSGYVPEALLKFI